MKKLGIMVALLWAGQLFGQGALGDIVGEIKDKKSGDPVWGAEVFTESNGSKLQTRTDFDGRFRISAVEPGLRFVTIVYKGDTLRNLQATVPMDGYANLGLINFSSEVLTFEAMDASAKDGRMKLEYGSLPVKEISSEDIAKSPAKFSVKEMITSVSTDVRMTEDGELVFRGARKGDMLYLVDGVKTSDIGQMPSAGIGRMQIYSGGLPAKYGDTLGGVVVMETKGYFDLYNAWRAGEIRNGN